MKRMVLAIGLSASAAIAAPAMATEKASASVQYADLDLTSEDGQRELDRRISRAAKAVCESELQRTGTRIRNSAYRECQASVQAQLERRIARITTGQQRGG